MPTRPTIDFIFRITDDVLWNTFKKNEIGDVLLPFVVLRRLDCMLEANQAAVRKAYLDFQDKVPADRLPPILQKAAGGLTYYNVSQYDLRSLATDAQNIEINFRSYLHGFSANVTDILDNYQLDKVVARLVKNGLLFQLVEAIAQVDLHLDAVSNHDMGYIFEELIRISNEQSNETAGEHFTPREVIRLMVQLIFCTEEELLKQTGIIRTIYDPACGTGGMLTLAKAHVLEHINPQAEINIFGQEINEQSYAIAKSDLLITGENPQNIQHGNTFTEDKFPRRRFHYILANPPYGVNWKRDAREIKREALNPLGRFPAGLPRTSDGQLLFLQHMVSKLEENGGRLAMVSNGSPLFTGDAGSGESEIRRWIIDNDWLDALIALPKDLFYNTGIQTYIWLVTNQKSLRRQGQVQLIDASGLARPMKKSLGNKRQYLGEEEIKQILDLYLDFEENERSKILPNDHFGYFQITVEQPKLNAKGQVQRDGKGHPKPDPKRRDRENIPLGSDIEAYFTREIEPHVPNGWVAHEKTRLGYAINFSRYFYQYEQPESAEDLKKEIEGLEKEIQALMGEVF